jgi:hypothetical protein
VRAILVIAIGFAAVTWYEDRGGRPVELLVGAIALVALLAISARGRRST